MTLDELLSKLPPEAQAIGQQYGPDVLKMTADDLKAWLNYALLGDYISAYKLYLKAADAGLLAEWGKVEGEWQAANEKNAAKMELSKEIAFAVAKGLVLIVTAALGF